MRKSKLLPRSKATNAYDLLTDVKKTILEEPKRLDMGFWIYRGKRLDDLLRNRQINNNGAQEAPACGTVACIAGWVTTLANRTPRDAYDIEEKAKDILAPYERDADGLTYERIIDRRSSLYHLFHDQHFQSNPGTKGYAKEVAAKITQFQRTYKSSLLNTPVKIRRRPKPKAKTVRRGNKDAKR